MITKLGTIVQTKQREIVRFLKFSVVGVFGAVVDFATYKLMINVFHLTPAISVAISLSTAIVSNFIWNRYWTYPDSRSKPVVRQFVVFYFINFLAYLIRGPIIIWTKEPFSRLAAQVLALETEAAAGWGDTLSWALGVGIALFWNFFVNRFFTYSDVE